MQYIILMHEAGMFNNSVVVRGRFVCRRTETPLERIQLQALLTWSSCSLVEPARWWSSRPATKQKNRPENSTTKQQSRRHMPIQSDEEANELAVDSRQRYSSSIPYASNRRKKNSVLLYILCQVCTRYLFFSQKAERARTNYNHIIKCYTECWCHPGM